MDFDAANLKRDRRLRRRLLQTLHAVRVSPRGGLHGRRLIEIVEATLSPGELFESDDHAIGLLKDLEAKGYATLADERKYPQRQRYSLDWLFAAVTDRGSMLIRETMARDPDVADARDPEEGEA